MRLLIVSEYNPANGSGYTTITQGLARELGDRHELIILGFHNDGGQHDLNAVVVPAIPNSFLQQARVIMAGFRPEALVVIFDLAFHYRLQMLQGNPSVPYVGIFPVESDPLVHPHEWTNCVDTMDAALCETRFGTALLNDVGIKATWLPVGVDAFWRPPSEEERAAARAAYNVQDRFVVLTVADNNERKNLPAHFAAMALLRGQEIIWPPLVGPRRKLPGRKVVDNAFFILNTKERKDFIGWIIHDLASRFGLAGECLLLEHSDGQGLEPERLRELYWASDAMLLLSKAEGLGLPVMEAQACGLPVVGTKAGGIAENLGDRRGYLIEPEYVALDAYANQWRRWAHPLAAAEALSSVSRGGDPRFAVSASLTYIREFTWERSARVLEEILNGLPSRTPAPAATGPGYEVYVEPAAEPAPD